MTSLDPQITVAALVADLPARARLFERLGIAYCCDGGKTLARACRDRGLDAWTLLQVLIASKDMIMPPETEADPNELTLAELADQIERVHHAYLTRELPRLARLMHNVLSRHGTDYPSLHELQEVLERLADLIQIHQAKEEQAVFPAICLLESEGNLGDCQCGGLEQVLREMRQDHEQFGGMLLKIRELTWGFSPPRDACESFRSLYDGLRGLETDIHRHVHKENNILFPRAIALEREIFFPPVPQL